MTKLVKILVFHVLIIKFFIFFTKKSNFGRKSGWKVKIWLLVSIFQLLGNKIGQNFRSKVKIGQNFGFSGFYHYIFQSIGQKIIALFIKYELEFKILN